MKAQTIWLGSEASILLQWQTTPDNMSHSSMLGVAKQQDPYSHCQGKLHGKNEKLWREEFKREKRMRASEE